MPESTHGEEGHPEPRSNRPHCLYLWYLRGVAVCSEYHNHRSCAYPFWDCPARKCQDISEKKESGTMYGISPVRPDILDESGSV